MTYTHTQTEHEKRYSAARRLAGEIFASNRARRRQSALETFASPQERLERLPFPSEPARKATQKP